MTTSHPEYDIKTSALTVAEAFSEHIRGKTILITGVSPNGIGAATAQAFAAHSPSLLLLASRTQSKLSTVIDSLKSDNPSLNVQAIPLDLSSQASVRAAAAQISSLTPKLDLLINNAGLSVMTRFTTPEGIEGQFGTNHVGPFLLTNLLLPLLEKAASEVDGEGKKVRRGGETRIVNVASGAHTISPIRFHDYNLELKNPVPPEEEWRKGLPQVYLNPMDGYLGIVAYGQSKTANILFTVSLQKEMAKRGMAAYCLHPGGVRTHLGRDQGDDINAAIEKTASYWKGPDQGASTTMVAALDPALDKHVGLYMDNCQFHETLPMPHAKDPVLADRLWALSEELVGEKFKL